VSKLESKFKEFYGSFGRPRDLTDAKRIADTLIDLLEVDIGALFPL
jgi:hypothetical protein